MRPFKIFFGLAIGVILFLFVARVVLVAFIVAAIMSIIYAAYRRIKDFVTYDRYGEYYIPAYTRRQEWNDHLQHKVEPLFYGSRAPFQRRKIDHIHFVEAK